MNTRHGILFLALLPTLIFISFLQTVTATAVSPTALILINTNTPEQLEEADVTLYARIGGDALLVGADADGQRKLSAYNFPHQILDSDSGGANYYLVHLVPNQRAAKWEKYGRFLHMHSNNTILLDVASGQTEQLVADGYKIQAITPDPKPFTPVAGHIPTAIQPDPIIQSMMDQVISGTVYQYDGNLSGEWPVTIGGAPYTIQTRHTYSGEPLQKATAFVGEHLAGLGMSVENHQWHGTYPPNVIGEITGQTDPDEIYIISAHLDDMPSGGPIAPGADDNASGVTAALIAADILSQYEWGCTIRFALWTGEEQGLLGSAAYAQRASNMGENIAGVLNLDMIAYNTLDSSPDIDLHANSSLPETLVLAQLFADVIAEYNIDLIPQIVSNGTGASDHASFWNYGYTSILGIEDYVGTGDFNPYYHTTNDLLANVDIDYFTEFVRASIGAFVHMNGCLIADGLGGMDGTITAVSSGTPIPNATVKMDNGINIFTATTDGTGYYTRTLMADTYTVTASAYGYLPTVVTGTIVITDTVATQNLALEAAPTYTISGTITEDGSGLPLAARIEFEGSPVTVDSDPLTGFYSATLPVGAYTMQVTAVNHRPQTRPITVDQNQIQNFALESLPSILLIDDDNNAPDVRSSYTAVLDALGYDYDIFDTGGGSGDGPALAEMEGYQAIIWFSGDKFGSNSAGPNSGDESNLAAFLDDGGHLFLSSQDYLYDMGLTSFGQNYLGVGSFTSDNGDATSKYGVSGDPVGDGLGAYPLSYPSGFSDYGDIVNAGTGASQAFRSSASGGNGLDVDKDGGVWKTVFFGTSWVPVHNSSAVNGGELMERILTWFDCGECTPVTDAVLTQVTMGTIYAGDTVTFSVDIAPNTAVPYSYTVFISETAVISNQVSALDPLTLQHTFNYTGSYDVTIAVWNCDMTEPVTDTLTVIVQPVESNPILSVTLTQVTTGTIYAGDVVTFSADIMPEAAVPYSYTVFISETAVISNQVSALDPLTLQHTFNYTGSYDVTIAVWNYDMTEPVTDTLTVIVQPPVYTLYLPVVVKPPSP